MRLEKQREMELSRRKGLTRKTIAQLIFFVIAFVIGFYLSGAILEEGLITESRMRGVLPFLRRLPEWGPRVTLTLAIVILMQILFSFGFVLSSGAAWKRVGRGTLESKNPDLFDDYR